MRHHFLKFLHRLFHTLWVLLQATLLVSLCFWLTSSHKPTLLEKMYERGRLTVASRNSPVTIYEDKQGATGLEYHLVAGFARFLSVDFHFHQKHEIPSLLNQTAADHVDFAAASLAITPEREKRFDFTRPYQWVDALVIYQRKNTAPASLNDIVGGNLLIAAGSAHSEYLRHQLSEHPELKWRELQSADDIDLIEAIHEGEVDFAVVDEHMFAMNASVFPNAQIGFVLKEQQPIAWAFPKHVDKSLVERANTYLYQTMISGKLSVWVDRQKKPHLLDESSALTFSSRMKSQLPKWRDLFEQAGKQHGLDWTLIAAISYQESLWNAKAKSYTGVRGLMMLTKAAAKDMGIRNRVDPKQSIEGGTRYFKKLMERLPKSIEKDNRLWMALAAYNVGFGHLEDARVLTQRRGGDPNKWHDVRQNLPLLAKRQYHSTLKFGFARGWEPIHYVDNIRNYYDILSWHELVTSNQLNVSQYELHADTQPAMFTDENSVPNPPVQ